MANVEKKKGLNLFWIGIIALAVGLVGLILGDIIGRVNVEALGAPFDALGAFVNFFATFGALFTGEAVSILRLAVLLIFVAAIILCAILFVKALLQKGKSPFASLLLLAAIGIFLLTMLIGENGIGNGQNGLWGILLIFSGVGSLVAVFCFALYSLLGAGAKEINEGLQKEVADKDKIREIVREELNSQGEGDAEELRMIIRAELEDFKKNAAPTNIYVNMTADEPLDEPRQVVEEKAKEEEPAPAEEQSAQEEAPVEQPAQEEKPVEEPVKEEPIEEKVEEQPAPEETKEEEVVVPLEQEEAPAEETPEEETPVEEEQLAEEPAPVEEEAPAEEEQPEEPAPVAEETPAEEPVQEEPAPIEEERPEEVESRDASAIPNTGKSGISFEEKLADMDDELRAKFDDLVRHISYYGIKARVSKPGCTFSAHRERYVFIAITGKRLRVNYALDPADYTDSTIPVTTNTSNKFSDIPVTFKVKSDLSLKRAKMLVDDVMARRGVEKGEEPIEQEDLMPKPASLEEPEEEVKPEVEEQSAPVVEEPVLEEAPAEEPAPVEETPIEEEPIEEEPIEEEGAEPKEQPEEGGEGTSVPASGIPNTGKSGISFEEKLAEMEPDLKAKYDEFVNYIGEFGIKARISKPGCTFSAHRERYVFIAITGKRLRINFALDPADYAESTIPVTTNTSKKFADLPVTFKVKSDLSLKRAKMLVDDVMARKGVEKGSAPVEE